MITIQDLYNIVGNKIANEAQKALIRNNFPPQIAEQMCNSIDGQERAEHFQRLLREYNEWIQNQQRQQETVQRFFEGVLVTIFCGLFRYNIVIQKLNYADIS